MSIDVPTVIDHCDKQPWCGYLEEHLVLEEHQGETIESGTLAALRKDYARGYSRGTPAALHGRRHSRRTLYLITRCIALPEPFFKPRRFELPIRSPPPYSHSYSLIGYILSPAVCTVRLPVSGATVCLFCHELRVLL